jgi:hypothetical protein
MLKKEDLVHQSDKPVLNPSKWFKKLTIILVYVLLLTMFALGGYWLGARQQHSSPTDLITTPKPSWLPTATPIQQRSTSPVITTSLPDPTVLPIDASDWKTYRNEEYGFEVKYPLD